MSDISTFDKVDFKKAMTEYRARAGVFDVVDVPDRHYLMVDGHGDPNSSPAFDRALQALYPVAYTLKFASKRDLGRDYVVPPLEGLWWADDLAAFTTARDKSLWDWTLMLMVPEWLGPDDVGAAIEQVATKSRPAGLHDLRFELLAEGRCVQTLHLGSFDTEAETLARLHDEVIPGKGLRPVGKHHEIYLSDVRKVAPDRQRTVLRQPVRAAEG